MKDVTNSSQTLSAQIRDESVGIFRDRELLKSNYIVEENRIVGRDDQMSSLVTLLKPLYHDSSAPDILAYGPSGTGKSLITKRVANEYKSALEEQGRHLAVIDINCQWLTTNYQACEKIAEAVSGLDRVNESVSVSGLSTHKALSNTFGIVDDRYDAAIIIVDEIDLLVNPVKADDAEPAFSALLYQLSRMDSLVGFDTMSVIALTNSPDFMHELDGRAESSFNPRTLHFPDYDAHQLRDILNNRRDAFVQDVLTDDVIPLAAATAAEDHGDARKAVDLLRTAGDEAASEGAEKVREEHARTAQAEVEKDLILEIARGYSASKQTVLLAAAITKSWTKQDTGAVPTPVLKEVYEYICETIDQNTRSRDSILRYMSEFEIHGLLDSTVKGRGHKSGVYKSFKLNRQADYLIEALLEGENRFESVVDNTEEIAIKAQRSFDNFHG